MFFQEFQHVLVQLFAVDLVVHLVAAAGIELDAHILDTGILEGLEGPLDAFAVLADRIIAVNMTGTVTIMMIILLALMLKEGYLVDIALIYAMLSFLAVVLLCRIYIGIARAKKEGKPHG